MSRAVSTKPLIVGVPKLGKFLGNNKGFSQSLPGNSSFQGTHSLLWRSVDLYKCILRTFSLLAVALTLVPFI
jgi:hypothetical protein